MALVKWDPSREVDSLQSDVNRLFDSFFGRREAGAGVARRWVPAMDLTETEDELVLRADLPGLDRDDIEVEVRDGVLTVSGERRSEHEDKREGFHRIERSFGRFSRSLGLPRGVDPEAVRAEFDRGVLEVRLPKPAERRATRIEVAAPAQEVEAREGGAEEPRPSEPELAGAGA